MSPVTSGPGRLIAATITILAAAFSIGTIAAVTGSDDAAEPDDIPVTIRDFAFEPLALEMPAGEVAVLVRNADATRHDFTIDGAVSIDIPGDRTRRGTFSLPTGDYTYWCTLHPAMTGRLHIS